MLDRRQLLVSAGALAVTTLQADAADDVWPSRAIRLVVPFTPGGSSDIVGRLIAQKLTDVFGQPVLIENRPGAGGSVATVGVAAANPDGYTILAGAVGTLAYNPVLYPNANLDPVKSFAPVIQTGVVPSVLVVNSELPVKSVADLVSYAKANPRKLKFGSAGLGSSAHVSMAYFNSVAGLEMVHVPYKGTAQSVTDCVANRVQLTLTGAPALLPFLQSGQLRGLGIASTVRLPALSGLPAISESGFPDFDVEQWLGLVAPAKTPTAIIERLFTEIRKLQDDPQFVAQLAVSGAVPVKTTREEFGNLIARETKRWGELIPKLGIQAE